MHIAEVIVRCRVERPLLERWIALSWVRPLRAETGWQFSETDIARIELICDLNRDLGIDDEAIEVILPLLDQIYALRHRVRALSDAIAALPEELRSDVLDRLDRAQRR
jgi:chaperone modulatory protein CbpM